MQMRLISRASISSTLLLQLLLEARRAVAEVERLQVVDVLLLAAADRVEVVFHLGGELVVDQAGQMLFQQLHDGERDPGRHQRAALLEHVVAGLNRVDDRGVRAGPADAALFERLGERRFAESARAAAWCAPWRSSRRTRALRRRRRSAASISWSASSASGVVAAFDVGPQVAGEVDRLAAHLEDAAFAFDRDRDPPAAGVGHLAGDRPLPDHVEQLEFVGARAALRSALGQLERMAGRANRLRALPARS